MPVSVFYWGQAPQTLDALCQELQLVSGAQDSPVVPQAVQEHLLTQEPQDCSLLLLAPQAAFDQVFETLPWLEEADGWMPLQAPDPSFQGRYFGKGSQLVALLPIDDSASLIAEFHQAVLPALASLQGLPYAVAAVDFAATQESLAAKALDLCGQSRALVTSYSGPDQKTPQLYLSVVGPDAQGILEATFAQLRKEPVPKKKKGFFARVFPSKGDSFGEGLRKVLLLVCILVFLGSAGYLANYYLQSYRYNQMSSDLSALYHTGGDGQTDAETKNFDNLLEINPYTVGWISIDGTVIDYPVVWYQGNNSYFLRRDFYQNSNQHGTIFVDGNADPSKPSDNLTLYGHNMKDGLMFGALPNYQELDYYLEHPIISFDTIYGEGDYAIFAVFVANTLSSQGDVFPYTTFIDAQTDDIYRSFVENVKVRSLIDTGIDVQPGDELITLSTCLYDFDEERLVVVARKLRDGENPDTIAQNAKENPNPLMPEIWYETYGGTPPTVSNESLLTLFNDYAQNRNNFWENAFVGGSSVSVDSSGSSLEEVSSSGSSSEESFSGWDSSSSSPGQIDPPSSSGGGSSSSSSGSASGGSSSAGGSAGGSSESQPSQGEDPSEGTGSGQTFTMYVNGQVQQVDAYEAVCRNVQAETGGAFYPEALKAQAVACYTYLTYCQNHGTIATLPLSTPNAAVQNAVSSVFGELITYNGQPINAVYYATSAGKTNDSADVWGGSLPYLKSVDSSVDRNAPGYRATKTFSEDQVRTLLQQKLGITPSGDPSTWFQVLSETSGGYNGLMSVCGYTTSPLSGQSITGRVLREQVFSLRSACFDVEYTGSAFVFTTYGYGHGVGMSQNGANLYAAQGWTYRQILTHYYTGVNVG